MSNNSGKWFGGLLLGAIAGAVAGLLLAPQSGKETREQLSKEAEKLKGELDKYADDFSEKAKVAKTELEAKLKEAQEKLRNYSNNSHKHEASEESEAYT